MLFYQIDAKLDEGYGELLMEEMQKDGQRAEDREGALYRRFREATANWNDRLTGKMYFVSELKKDVITFGFISEEEPADFSETSDYLFYLGVDFEYMETGEITWSELFELRPAEGVLPSKAECMKSREEQQFYEMLGIRDRTQYLAVISSIVDENIFISDGVEEDEKLKEKREEIRRERRRRFPSRSLQAEFERIESLEVPAESEEPPVFYVIESDDEEFRLYAIIAIMRALYRKGRIISRKFMGIYGFSAKLNHTVKLFSRLCGHGSLLFRFTNDEGDANPYNAEATDAEQMIHIAEWMTQFGDHTQTFFMVPRICDEIKLLLNENKEKFTFVEIRQDNAE